MEVETCSVVPFFEHPARRRDTEISKRVKTFFIRVKILRSGGGGAGLTPKVFKI